MIRIDQRAPVSGAGSFEAEATVTGVKMLGAIVRYAVESAAVPLKLDQLNRPSAKPLAVGSLVRLRLAAADVREL